MEFSSHRSYVRDLSAFFGGRHVEDILQMPYNNPDVKVLMDKAGYETFQKSLQELVTTTGANPKTITMRDLVDIGSRPLKK